MQRGLIIAVMAVALTGCALPHTRVYLPDPSLKSDTTLGYHTEQDRHDIRLVHDDPKMVPGRVWTEEAFPFGEKVHIEWDTAGYPFVNDYWCPFGVPTHQGEHGCVQTYEGIKQEGNKKKEFVQNGWTFSPMEFHPVEQNAWRWKTDLEIGCSQYNMAGCIEGGRR